MKTSKLQLKHIIELDCELNRVKDQDILLERILLEARKMVGADAGSIYIIEDNKLAINYSQNDTIQADLPPGQKLIYSLFKVEINTKSIAGYVAATGAVINIPDVYKTGKSAPYQYDSSYDKLSGYMNKSMLAIPLRTITGRIVGVIQVINATDKDGKIIPFTKDDELFVTHFADNAAMALERAQMTRAIILRMIRMAELRDPKETGMHVNRVAGYSVELYEAWARKHNISEKEVQRNRDILRMAAMLHDVGKVAISDAILKKPAKFTPEEFAIMKAHTWLGADLFKDSEQSEFDDMAMQIALTHHEKWNGDGYPGRMTGAGWRENASSPGRGLSGEEIPIWGRIVAVTDVYDALSSRRVYKESWPEEQVLSEIRKLSGTSFDPELVELFFEIMPMLKHVESRYHEIPD
ncbi:MAG: GAF domain-containing protein [Spirochaetaceae bacterium]|nr:MAG: GAF domain-containing protein [Spirochaetaceae bacterium]